MKRLAFALALLATPASAQIITPAPSGFQRLYSTGTSVGNGADTTEDVMQTFTLAAGQLANIGDTVHIVASGTAAATTDTKTIRLRIGGTSGTAIVASNATAANTIRWTIEAWIIKTGSGTQAYLVDPIVRNGAINGIDTGTLSVTDTATIQLVISGQNSTAASAGSVTCQTMIVDFEH